MQEVVPELLLPGGVQWLVISVKYAPRQLQLIHSLEGLGQGRHRPGAPLHIVQRHPAGRIQQRSRPFDEIARAQSPLENPFFRHG